MKLRGRLPPEFLDIWVEKGAVYLLAPDAVMVAEIKKPRFLSEIIRWTGTNLKTLTANPERVIIGTDRGAIVIEGGEPKPVWVGSSSLILMGNFSPKHKIMIIAEKSERGITVPNVFVPSVISEDTLRSAKKVVSRGFGEIAMFPAAVSPFRSDLMLRAKRLVKRLDVDKDGFDEVVTAAHEEGRSHLSVVKISADRDEESGLQIRLYEITPVRDAYPQAFDVNDIDGDGVPELVALLQERHDFDRVHIITFSHESSGKGVIPLLLGSFRFDELFNEALPDDADLYVFAGRFLPDSLPEILVVAYVPPYIMSRRGRLYVATMDMCGVRSHLQPTATLPVKLILREDVDADGADELVVLSHTGYEVLKVVSRDGRKVLERATRFYMPSRMEAASEIKDDEFFIAGPLLVGSKIYIISRLSNTFIEHVMSLRLVDMRIGLNSFAILGTDGRIVLCSDGRLQKLMFRNLKDLAFWGETFYLIDGSNVYRLEEGNTRLVYKGKRPSNFVYTRDGLAVMDGHVVSLKTSKKVCEAQPGLIAVGAECSALLSGGQITVKCSSSTSSIALSGGFSRRNIIPIKFEGKFGVLAISQEGELYFLDLDDGGLIRAELTNIVGASPLHDDRIILTFENNWLVEYELKEVLSLESESI